MSEHPVRSSGITDLNEFYTKRIQGIITTENLASNQPPGSADYDLYPRCCALELRTINIESLFRKILQKYELVQCGRYALTNKKYCRIHINQCVDGEIYREFWNAMLHGKRFNIISEDLQQELAILFKMYKTHHNLCITGMVYVRAEMIYHNEGTGDIYYYILMIYLALELIAKIRTIRKNMCFYHCPDSESKGHDIIIDNFQAFGTMVFKEREFYKYRYLLNPVDIDLLLNLVLIDINDNYEVFNLYKIYAPNEIEQSIINRYSTTTQEIYSDDNSEPDIIYPELWKAKYKQDLYNIYHIIRNYYISTAIDIDTCKHVIEQYAADHTDKFPDYKNHSMQQATFIERVPTVTYNPQLLIESSYITSTPTTIISIEHINNDDIRTYIANLFDLLRNEEEIYKMDN